MTKQYSVWCPPYGLPPREVPSIPIEELRARGFTVVDVDPRLTFCYDPDLNAAVTADDRAAIAKWLRSRAEIGPDERDLLAAYVEGSLVLPAAGPGQPLKEPGIAVRQAAFLVSEVKAAMRAAGRKYRIHEEAVDRAFERMRSLGLKTPSREALENYLNRSSSRKYRTNRK